MSGSSSRYVPRNGPPIPPPDGNAKDIPPPGGRDKFDGAFRRLNQGNAAAVPAPPNRFPQTTPAPAPNPFRGPPPATTPVKTVASTVAAPTPAPAAPSVTKKPNAKAEAKLAQKEAREAAEAKARLQKEEEEQRRRDADAARAAQDEGAGRVLDLGLTGAALRDYIAALPVEQRPTGPSLARQVLARQAEPTALGWTKDAEFGSALKLLLARRVADQLDTLYVLQAHCNALKFPKIDVKGKPSPLVELLFSVFWSNELADDMAFLQWADDESEHGDRGTGKLTAVVQTTNFFLALRAVPERDEDEEEEDDVDEERETVK